MTRLDDLETEMQIRQARWLIEQALPKVKATPQIFEVLELTRTLLGQIAGDYRDGEEARFAAATRP
jgi:hypothetical protein